MNDDRWHTLLGALGAAESTRALMTLQLAASERHRRFHTREHIDDNLAHFDVVRALSVSPLELEAAIWLKDCVCNPMQSNNAEPSARWASELLMEAGVARAKVAYIAELILATDAKATPVGVDQELIVDISRAYFALEATAYTAAEVALQIESGVMPPYDFRNRRTRSLKAMLRRRKLYTTPFFFEHFESLARSNIAARIETLAIASR